EPTGATGGPFVAPGGQATGEGAYRLNFENAQIGEVVRAILGDSLGLNYVIDPQVSGRVTLVSARPVVQEDLIPILEAILRLNQAALVTDGVIYKVVLDDAVGNLPVMPTGAVERAGYG